MAIDVSRDELIPIAEAAAKLPNKASTQTLWRWWKKGVPVVTPLPSGGEEIRRVKLETIRIGRWRYTTRKAFADFVAATNPAAKAIRRVDRDTRTDAKLRKAGVL